MGKPMKITTPQWMHQQLDVLAEWRTAQIPGSGRVRRAEIIREVLQMGMAQLQSEMRDAGIEVPGFDPAKEVLRNGR